MIKAVAKKRILNLSLMKRHGIQCLQGLDAGRFDVIANQVGVNKDREKNINSLNLTHIQVLYLLFVKKVLHHSMM